ncbi:MAG: DUF438 domain-containing protein [Eubacteriales bacterium]
MSELINNRKHRQEKLKELIKKLHDGAAVEEVQEEFHKLTIGVTATEITEMEQALVNEGMPVSDIQRLCDVHAAVFKGSIEDIHNDEAYISPDFEEGHPVHTFKLENRAIESLMQNEVQNLLTAYSQSKSTDSQKVLLNYLKKLATIDNHYKRKENLLFPYMERYDITAPPQVMWGVDDEIREMLKGVISKLEKEATPEITEEVNELTNRINEMIFKEEEIMFPMILEKFTQDEWIEIEKAGSDIGYTLIASVKQWTPQDKNVIDTTKPDENTAFGNSMTVQKDSSSKILFDAGSLTAEEINSILNTVPIDMTFVGADNRVKYFTQGKERIFERPVTIIGREVKNCHPPKSVHIVEQIVEDLKSGKKDNEDFWIKMGDVFVYIRYFAVRNKKGEFLGTLEISQNIKPIIELEGEKRLMS